MKNYYWLIMVVVLVLSSPALAMKTMPYHSDLDAGGKMILLPEDRVDGILASAHLMDIRDQLAEHGLPQTHHLMVRFLGEDGEEIVSGEVALKLTTPAGEVLTAEKMQAMDGHFGLDIFIDQKGVYYLKVGTRFADGKARTFETRFENK